MEVLIHWLSDIFWVLLLTFGILVLAGLSLDLLYVTYRTIADHHRRKEPTK